MGEECKQFLELFSDGLAATTAWISHSHWREVQNLLPNERKGRWECSLSGQDEPDLPWLKST